MNEMSHVLRTAADNLTARGFEIICCSTAQQARETVLRMIQPGQTVGIGGSVTVRELGLAESLLEAGHRIFWHWMPSGSDLRKIYLQANCADVYLASANAVTVSGIIVNIDGTGNRVAAMNYGPKRVILIVGRNKLVDGGIPAAIARIKRDACPPNARRLGRNTPCAADGVCDAAHCENSMCRITDVMEKAPGGHPVTVVLVDEAMGY